MLQVTSYKKQAFTIIEFLVIISLISVLSAILILTGQNEERKFAVQRSAIKTVQDIREAQERAMAAEEFDCAGTKVYSYGIFAAAPGNSFEVFADCNGNKSKDVADGIIKEIETEKGVIIYSTSPANLTVVFVPPEPVVFINGSSFAGEAVITLSLENNPGNSANWKKIKINTVGRIEIE